MAFWERGNHARHCYLPCSRTAHRCPIYKAALAGDVLTVWYDLPAQLQPFPAGGLMPPGNSRHAHFTNARDFALHMLESEGAIKYKALKYTAAQQQLTALQVQVPASFRSLTGTRQQTCANKALLREH